MLEHLKLINANLRERGLNTSYGEWYDEANLSWFDIDNTRHAITIWFKDGEGVWISVKGGIVKGAKEFDSVEEFLEFTV